MQMHLTISRYKDDVFALQPWLRGTDVNRVPEALATARKREALANTSAAQGS